MANTTVLIIVTAMAGLVLISACALVRYKTRTKSASTTQALLHDKNH